MNKAQKSCCLSYSDGEFSWVIQALDDGHTLDKILHGCGDGLFRFLMVELADKEDCNTLEEAFRRCHTAISEIDTVATAIAKLGDIS